MNVANSLPSSAVQRTIDRVNFVTLDNATQRVERVAGRDAVVVETTQRLELGGRVTHRAIEVAEFHVDQHNLLLFEAAREQLEYDAAEERTGAVHQRLKLDLSNDRRQVADRDRPAVGQDVATIILGGALKYERTGREVAAAPDQGVAVGLVEVRTRAAEGQADAVERRVDARMRSRRRIPREGRDRLVAQQVARPYRPEPRPPSSPLKWIGPEQGAVRSGTIGSQKPSAKNV